MVSVDLSSALDRVIRGNASAFRDIVEATSSRMVRVSARLLGSVADAEDVVQDAYVKAFRKATESNFEPPDDVGAWLYRIVVNASLDAMRSKKRRPARDEMDNVVSTLASAETHAALAELADWLSELPEEQRVALTLTAVEGLSGKEAADVLGISEGAVEQRVVRARAALRQKRSDEE